MKVLIATTAGFCRGVKRAVEKAQALRREHTGPIHTDGPLIHNEPVLRELREQGIVETDDPWALKDGALVIRAHGIPPDRRQALRQLPVALVDATCPDVARIHGLIRMHVARGYHILIFGDPGHAEVTGLMGYAQGRGHVVTRPEDVAGLPDISPICVCSQSTQFPEDYERIAAAARARFPDVVVLDTICDATKNRQAELVTMAAQVDAFVVVGSRHSANTMRLVQLARTLRPTVHIETRAELNPSDLDGVRTVGLTAGASTPDFVIRDVQDALAAL